MKRFFSLLTLLVMILTTGGYVHAQTTYEISNNSDTKPTKGDGSPWTFVSKNKTFKITYSDLDPQKSKKTYATGDNSKLQGSFKCSNGYEYTLTIPDGLSISTVTFNGYSNNDSKSSWLSYNGEEKKDDTFMGRKTSNFEAKSYTYDWPANSSSITFKPCNSETVITITLTEAANTNKLSKPSITYTQAGLVTITPAEGKTPKEIRYTTDGTDPSATVGEIYSTPFNAAGKTVKAIAIANEGMENSDIETVEVPKAVQSTKIDLTKVTVAGTPIEASELESLIANKTLTLSTSYAVAPAVVFTKTTTTTYTDASTSTESEDVNATVTKGTDNFVATATIGEIEYTINLPLNKTASITTDVTSFDFSVKRAEVATKAIKFTAVNASGIVKINTPNVEGLSTSLSKQPEEGASDVTVADGETVTLTVKYMPETAVAKTSDKITIAVGETTLDIPFTYEDTEDMITEYEKVTGDMSWDFSTAASADVAASGRSTLVPFANKKESFNEGFKYEYLLEKNAVYLYRKGYTCFQGTELHFYTTVPGTVEVVFSNTGKNSARTAKICDKICEEEGSTSGSTNVTAKSQVEAGDVSIAGWMLKEQQNNAIRIYSVKFTADKTTDITISNAKMATYSNTSAWEIPAGVQAYTAKYADNKIKLTEVTGTVPANTGVVLYGEPKTYTANLTTTTATLADNDLVPTANAAYTVVGNTTYALVAEKDAQGNKTGKICFGRLEEGSTVAQGKAYLKISGSSAAKQLSIDLGGETTGISTVENATETQNDVYYTLGGQRTVKPLKGLYIHNGKKYMK